MAARRRSSPQPIVGLPNHLSGMSTPTSLSRLHKKLRRIWVRKFRKFEPIDRSLFFFFLFEG